MNGAELPQRQIPDENACAELSASLTHVPDAPCCRYKRREIAEPHRHLVARIRLASTAPQQDCHAAPRHGEA